jgi:hypothetical protein
MDPGSKLLTTPPRIVGILTGCRVVTRPHPYAGARYIVIPGLGPECSKRPNPLEYGAPMHGSANGLIRRHLLSPLGKTILLPSSGSTQVGTTFGIFFRSVIGVSGELKVEVALNHTGEISILEAPRASRQGDTPARPCSRLG